MYRKAQSEVYTDKSHEILHINSSEDTIHYTENVSDAAMNSNSTCIISECDSDDMNSSAKENSNDTGDINNTHRLWNISENWHGLVHSTTNEQEVPIKKRAKPSYLDKCLE